MVKLGTLYPNGKIDDLGDADPQTGAFVPGTDSKKRSDEYGWTSILDDTNQFIVADTVEDTGELKYVFGIEVLNMAEACGDEGCQRTVWNSRFIDELGTDDSDGELQKLFKKQAAHLSKEKTVAFLKEHFDNDDEEIEDSIYDEEEPRLIVTLYVIPVSVTEDEVKQACGSDETFNDYLKPDFEKNGDWRAAAWDLNSYGHHVPVAGFEAWEDATAIVEQAKMSALQVKMLFGFYMDRRVNLMGETGWDWLKRSNAMKEEGEDETDAGEEDYEASESSADTD